MLSLITTTFEGDKLSPELMPKVCSVEHTEAHMTPSLIKHQPGPCLLPWTFFLFCWSVEFSLPFSGFWKQTTLKQKQLCFSSACDLMGLMLTRRAVEHTGRKVMLPPALPSEEVLSHDRKTLQMHILPLSLSLCFSDYLVSRLPLKSQHFKPALCIWF